MPEKAAPPRYPEHLVGDPGRQAVASLAGYSYQLWHSLLAWLTLSFDELLQLEGNEDIDVLRGTAASTTQVKRVSKTMTLRSEDAIEAINNFWSARGRNPSTRLTFKFLSTAEAGREAGDHFEGRRGLDVWRAARRGVDRQSDLIAALQIQGFLLSLGTLSAGLRTWLGTATPDDILTNLIQPLTWELGTADAAEVKLLVEDQLVRLGDSQGMVPSNSRKAAPMLLEKVLQKATNPEDRFLDRKNLLDAFEGATTITIPATGSGFVGRSARPTSVLPVGLAAALQAVQAAAFDGVPELPSILLQREGFVSSIVAKHLEGFVLLHGSTGMGKSTLASLVVGRMHHDPLWLDLRASSEPYAVIRAAVSRLVQIGDFRTLVLDDVDFGGDSRRLQDAIAAAFTATRAVGGTMLITSATALPLALLLRLHLTADCQIAIPGLDEAEVDNLLLAHGLNDAAARRRWAKLVSLQTQGHSQLVDARVQALRYRGFPSIGPDDLQRVPSEISEIRQQARTLIAGLPPDQRDLLYRLSLNAMLFRKSAVVRIAGLTPALSAPGDLLDALVGPWIERTQGKRYRVSPLVVNAGVDANGGDWAKSTHSGIASQLLTGKLDQFDVAAICLHAVAGGNGQALTTVCVILLSRVDGLAEIAELLAWLVYVDPSSPRLGLDRKSASAVRIVQFEIATHLDAATIEVAIKALEFHTRVPAQASASDRSTRLIAICKMLMRTEVYIQPRLIVSLTAELIELQTSDPRINSMVRNFSGGFHSGVPDQFDLASMLATFMPGRLKSAEDLNSLWDSLAELPHNVRTALLRPLSTDPTLAQLTTDAVWLCEGRTESPDWQSLLSATLRGYELARVWDCGGLAAAAAVTAVRILNENLGTGLNALRLGRKVIREIGTDNRVVDAIADVMDRAGRPRVAYLLRLPIVSSWQPTVVDRFGPALIRRKAGRSAARAGEWAAAATYFSDAADAIADDQDEDIFRAGLLADAGHAASKAGDKESAIDLLTGAFQLLQSIPNDPSNRKAFRLHKLFGNLISWLVEGARTNPDGTGTFEPPPATCSDLEIAKDWSKLPITPIEYLALNLCRYAGVVREGTELSDILAWLNQSPLIVVRCVAGQILVDTAISRRDLFATCRAAVFHARDLVHSVQSKAEPGLLVLRQETPPSIELGAEAVDELVKKPILSCLLAMVADSGWFPSGLDNPTALTSDELPADLHQWMQTVATLTSMTSDERWKSFRAARTTSNKYSMLMFAISLADDRDASNQHVGHCHAVLFQAVQSGALPAPCASSLVTIMVRRWSEIAQQPFRLTYPRLTLPDLRAALLSGDQDLKKAGSLLLAGLPAIGVHVPIWLDAALKGSPHKPAGAMTP